MTMRVLVCGGRDYISWWAMEPILDRLVDEDGISVLIEGGAQGADRLARGWAMMHDIPVETYEADWKRDGRSAGPIRNMAMLIVGRPDLVVAFPGGRGTMNMVEQARKRGIEVRVVECVPC